MKSKSKSPKQAFRVIKIIVEKHAGGYIAYPLGVKGSCVGQGDTFDEAFACVKNMLVEYVEVFGQDVLEDIIESPIQEVFVAETRVCA